MNLPRQAPYVAPPPLLTFAAAEKNVILQAIARYPKESPTGLAHRLGVSRATMYNMLLRHEIQFGKRASRRG